MPSYDVSARSSYNSMMPCQELAPVCTACSLVVNGVAFLLVFVGTIVMNFLEIPVMRNGFYCDDETIRYPYKPNTVGVLALFLVTLGPALITVIVAEGIRFWKIYSTGNQNDTDTDSKGANFSWKNSLALVGIQVVMLLYGFALTVSLTEMCKFFMGRLRPHFLDVCQLEPGSYNCSQNLGYVTEYTCTQTNQAKLLDARKSFLSGHSSISFYFMIFIATYVSWRMPKIFALPKLTIQALCVLLATYIAISRLTDHMHHPTDVIAGALLGTVVGYFAVIRLATLVGFTNSECSPDVLLQQVKTA